MTLADDLEWAEWEATEAPDIDVGHAIPLESHEDGSSAWHDARRQGLGGSDVAQILGMQPYGDTRVDLWRQKTGREDPRVANAATRFGSLIEPYIREWLVRRADDTPAQYRQFAGLIDYPVQVRHPDYEWARGNTDGLLVRDGEATAGVEIKNSTVEYRSDRYDWPEGVREYHYPQIQHYMWVTDLPEWWYVYTTCPMDREMARLIAEYHAEDRDEFYLWLIDKGDVHVERVERNESYIDRMKSAEFQFWHEHIESDTEPEEWLPDGEIRVSDDELEQLLDEYGRAHAKIKAGDDSDEVEAQKEEAKVAIKQRAQSIAADHSSDPKKIWVNGDDYVLWHGGYSDWTPKPAERKPREDDDLGF